MALMQLVSPHPFAERFCFFGGAGAGKTNSVLSIADHVTGRFHICDADYSLAYERAFATDFPDVEERATIYENDADWPTFLESVQAAAEAGDPDNDWLVVDPAPASWGWVQDWFIEKTYGVDLPTFLAQLKAEFKEDSKGYGRAVVEAMNWPIINKEYEKFYRIIKRWKGHMILVAETKQVAGNEKDEELKRQFGPLGFRPAGQSSMPHKMATNIFMEQSKRGVWRITTTKDRNRELVDKLVLPATDEGGFAIEYLMGIAGWRKARGAKAAVAAEVE